MAVVLARTGVDRTSLQERFERSRSGRVLISLFILGTVVVLLTANLPSSWLGTELLKADHPYLYGVGMDQNWGVFAPDPRQQTVDLHALVTFPDGSNETWQVPRRNPVVGEYLDYRWLKWAEYAVEPGESQLLRPAALYIARRLASPGHRPVRVILFDRTRPILPPGQRPAAEPVKDNPLLTLLITPAMLRGARE